jgi:4-hydroxy-3-polyprenylbenzoate decarboxylase
MKRFVLAITGASSVVFGVRLLGELLKTSEVHCIISDHALPIIRDEVGLDWSPDPQQAIRTHFTTDRVFCYRESNMYAPVASGSFMTDGMFVVPCSMKTLSAIANGYASNLIDRAADVTIKEARFLLLAPREMPLSAIHLENMLKLSRIGVRIAPPIPAFYHVPKDLDGVIDFIVGKWLDSVGIPHGLYARWGDERT